MDGLSPAGLRVLLHSGFDEFSSSASKLNDTETRPISASCERPFSSASSMAQARQSRGADEQILWHAHYFNLGTWQQAQILYTFPELHTVSWMFLTLMGHR